MQSIILIPARYQSSRFPGKPLVMLNGKPLIIWVVEVAVCAVGKVNVYVATDDARIFDLVESYGFQAVMTSSDALTGTDRLAEVAEIISADMYINVQGDEPLIEPEDIVKVIEAKKQNMDMVVNAYCWISEHEDPNNRNIPKVITSEDNRMVYMSRRALPGYKDIKNKPLRYKKQVCIYGFSRDELKDYRLFGRKSELEHSEDIEILRFIELGKEVLMVEASGQSMAVDVPEDVKPVENALKRRHRL